MALVLWDCTNEHAERRSYGFGSMQEAPESQTGTISIIEVGCGSACRSPESRVWREGEK